jgi:hypothetical protein
MSRSGRDQQFADQRQGSESNSRVDDSDYMDSTMGAPGLVLVDQSMHEQQKRTQRKNDSMTRVRQVNDSVRQIQESDSKTTRVHISSREASLERHHRRLEEDQYKLEEAQQAMNDFHKKRRLAEQKELLRGYKKEKPMEQKHEEMDDYDQS